MIQDNNQNAYDVNEIREKHCAAWLKLRKKSVNGLITSVAMIGILNGILVIIQAGLLAHIFHQLIIERVLWQQLSNYIGLFAIVIFIRSGCSYFFQTLGYKAAVNIKRSLREEILNKFYLLGPSYIKQQQSGELAAATLEQVEAVEGYFSNYLPQQIVVSVLPIIMIGVVLPVNWVVGVIFLVTGPLIPVFMALVGMGAASASRNQFLAMSRMSGYFLNRIQGLNTLKMFGQAETELVTISKVANDFREKTMSVLRLAFLSSAVLEFFSAVAVALVAVYVGLGLLGLVHFGPAINITLQEALFVLLLAPEFFNPLKQLASHYHDKAAAIGAVDHILKILEMPQAKQNVYPAVSSEYSIELQEVTKSYDQKQVLKTLNLQIKKGEKIAITGESGAGKTTLLKMIMGFEQASEGTVRLNGMPTDQEFAAKNIAWAGQGSSIFYATIKDNISLYNPKISEQQIITAADAAGVTEFSRQLEKGLLTLVGENGYGLSGGQVQRIALARAFVKQAPIVLLDEPGAHLDQENKTKLLDDIISLFNNKTLIIVSHDNDVIARMDRAVCLS